MNNQLFIPEKIKVGFVNRDDTYTKKLAYVIYYDAKGKLRKEASWEGWRDKKIDAEEFSNTPTEGFVLNKKVGGYKSDWNHRATYARVFDPRGFEFEISIPNLLFILQETDCTKGKGLIGEFVYAWDGTELVLLPAGCAEYVACTEYTSLQGGKVSARTLIPGAVYEDKKQNKYIYLGRYDWYEKICSWKRNSGDPVRKRKKNAFIFVAEGNDGWNIKGQIIHYTGLTSFARCINDTPVEELPQFIEKFKGMHESSPITAFEWGEKKKIELKPYPYDYGYRKYNRHSLFEEEGDKVSLVNIDENYDNVRNPTTNKYEYKFHWIFNRDSAHYSIVDGEVICEYPMVNRGYSYRKGDDLMKKPQERINKVNSEDELLQTEERILYAVLGSGQKTEFKNLI